MAESVAGQRARAVVPSPRILLANSPTMTSSGMSVLFDHHEDSLFTVAEAGAWRTGNELQGVLVPQILLMTRNELQLFLAG